MKHLLILMFMGISFSIPKALAQKIKTDLLVIDMQHAIWKYPFSFF